MRAPDQELSSAKWRRVRIRLTAPIRMFQFELPPAEEPTLFDGPAVEPYE